jgi:DNA-binding CsgD family transcriptional regulator
LESNPEALIASIYEAGLMPPLWPRILSDIARAVDARGGLLMAKRGDAERWVASKQIAPVVTEFVDQGWAEHNVRASRCRSKSSYAGFLTDTDIFTTQELQTLPIYSEFLRPRGLDAGAGTAIHGVKTDSLMITVEGFKSHSAAKRAVLFLDSIRPHLARAAAISARMRMEQANAATEALATIGVAAAVLASDASIVSANSPFKALLATLGGDGAGRFRLSDVQANAEFLEALRLTSFGSGRSLALRRRADKPCVLHLAPLIRSVKDVFQEGSALLVLDVPGTSETYDSETIRRLYDLTPAEAKVAHLVAEGQTPAEVARSLGVSIETIRTHLKHTFAKTGADGQIRLSAQFRSVASRRPE